MEITRHNTARNSNIELGLPVVPLPCLMEVNNLKTKFPVQNYFVGRRYCPLSLKWYMTFL